MNIILIGMKCCGKSTLGAALAKRWNCEFHDMDAIIENLHACDSRTHLSVRDIFTHLGEGYFHSLESMAVCELYLKLQQAEGDNIIALGGWTVMNAKVTDLFKGLGLTLYLQVTPEELFRRVKRSGQPPFLDDAEPTGDFLTLCQQREPYYRQLADIVINLDGLTIEQAVEQIVLRIEEYQEEQ